MDIISLYYFSELAKDLHMTHTANRLFISQQTLSNHIRRLEEELGVQLFLRKPGLSLTYAGEVVLSFADIVNKEYTNLTDILSDIEHQERGVIRFGASSMRANTCLPHILSEFSRQYPQVELRLTDAISPKLEPMVLDGLLDFAIILSGDPNPKLIDHHLLNDRVYLCVSESMLRQYYGEQTDSLKAAAIHGANVADFARLPFCMHSNRLGNSLLECFEEGGVAPVTLFTSEDTRFATSMCFRSIAACFATQMRLISRQDDIPADVNIFPVHRHGVPMVQRISLIRRKDRYLPKYSWRFLELLFQFFDELELLRPERCV